MPHADLTEIFKVKVKKRDGSVQDFDLEKIKNAVMKSGVDEADAKTVAHRVEEFFTGKSGPHPTVEEVSDLVEVSMMQEDLFDAAKRYIVYRRERTKARVIRKGADSTAMENYIHISKYSRYDPDLGRRESWEESVDRRFGMDLRRWPELEGNIREASDWVKGKKVLPSMRSMQFGGKAIEKNHARLYNCSFSLADRPRFFAEMFFLLLSGCGVGYSVQRPHVKKLPELAKINKKVIVTYQIQDSIEGWSDALDALMISYMNPLEDNAYVEFDYGLIRPMGEPLRTSGGKAPGHVPLKIMLEKVRAMLHDAEGRQLRPIEVHDICCHVAEAVLAGGIRRSSLISLFSIDDHEMMKAKTDKEYAKNPHRRMANNSAVIIRGDAHRHKEDFDLLFQSVKDRGDPGFFFTTHVDYGCNPCAEIGLNCVCPDTGKTGFGFCNLCEINAARIKSKVDFVEAARIAAFIGTLQAAYTDFPYLTTVSKSIVEREALLGISITGIVDNPDVLKPEWQRAACAAATAENIRVAKLLGIRPAARITTIKPSGTASLLLGCVGAGIHPHHARRYIRRVTANPLEPAFQYFKSVNPHMCVELPKSMTKSGDWVIEFPVEAPDGAIVRDDLSALAFIDMVFGTYENWVVPGTADMMSSPGMTHNVSCTVNVRENEWDGVREHIWKNRHRIAAMALLSWTGDKEWPFAPNEGITTAADEARWNEILEKYTPVDWTLMTEDGDTTDPRAVSACEGGMCLVESGPDA